MTSLSRDLEKVVETMAKSSEIHGDMGHLAGKMQEMAQAAQSKSGQADMRNIMEHLADWANGRKDDWSEENCKKALERLMTRSAEPDGGEEPSNNPAGAPKDNPADNPTGNPIA